MSHSAVRSAGFVSPSYTSFSIIHHHSEMLILSDMNECYSRPCQNQGQCVNGDNGNGYTCECQPGWEGVNCEIGR